jgi:hypothetical protein
MSDGEGPRGSGSALADLSCVSPAGLEPAGLEPAGVEPDRGALPSVTFVTAFKKTSVASVLWPETPRHHGPSAQKNPSVRIWT